MKKLMAILTLVAVMIISASCNLTVDTKVEARITQKTETVLAIEIDEASENATLLNAMRKLKENGELEYTTSGIYVTSINGVENKADYSGYWFIYTSDEENSYAEWGTYVLGDKTLASASYGAENLKLKAGETYVFVYTEFSW